MESVIVRMVCDADLCVSNRSMQLLRESTSVEDAEKLHEMYKASHE